MTALAATVEPPNINRSIKPLMVMDATHPSNKMFFWNAGLPLF
jgi:hypothetical protein